MPVDAEPKITSLAAEIWRDSVRFYDNTQQSEHLLIGFNPVLTTWNTGMLGGLDTTGSFRAISKSPTAPAGTGLPSAAPGPTGVTGALKAVTGSFRAITESFRTVGQEPAEPPYGGEVNLEHLFSRRVMTANYYGERTSRHIELWERVVGDHRDADSLRAQSPLYNAAKIRMPVLLAYSEDDTVMPFSDAKEMRDALKNGGNVEFMSKPGEPHLFENTANKIELYTRIDAFLQKCNPAD